MPTLRPTDLTASHPTGPPGTGKSLMIKQLMELFANAVMKVLILAPSNSATKQTRIKSRPPGTNIIPTRNYIG